jgi:trimeric autotransporter adhesin
MSSHRIKTIAALCAIACCMGPATARANKDKSHSGHHPKTTASSSQFGNGSSQIHLAADDHDEKKLSDLQGKKLTSSSGEELGTIQDVVLDTQSGKVAFVAVAPSATSGTTSTTDAATPASSTSDLSTSSSAASSASSTSAGAASGSSNMTAQLRLVPQSALQAADNDACLCAQLDQAAFNALPAVDRSDMEAGRIPSSMSATSSSSSSSSTSSTSPYDSGSQSSQSASGQFVLASKLAGKELRAGGEKVGTIETVALELPAGNAHAVLNAESDFAGTSDKFHVPMAKLQIASSDAQTVSTDLSRSDFTQAKSGSSGESSSTTDSSLSATGRSSTTTSSQTGDPYSSSPSSTSSASSTLSSPTSSTSPASTTSGSPSVDSSQYSSISPSSSTSASSTTSPSTIPDETGVDARSPSSTSVSNDDFTAVGRDSGSANDATSSTAAAIRTALSSDPSLASEDIRVQAAGKKIMLHGKVSDEATKSRIEQLAKTTAGGTDVENKVKVDR